MAKRKLSLGKRLDSIYSGPVAAFISGRDAIVKDLRADEESDEAKRIARLRKPSRAAAVANAHALEKPKSLTALLKVTDKIRDAMSGDLDRDLVQKLGREEADLLDRLLEEAAEIAEKNGEPASTSTLDRVRETLQAAQVDDGVREQLLAGRLEREARSASMGLGNLVSENSGGSGRTQSRTKKKAAPKTAARKAAKHDGRKAAKKPVDRKRLAKARESLEEAKKASRAARREVASAEGALTKAKRTLDSAAEREARAEAALAKARKPA